MSKNASPSSSRPVTTGWDGKLLRVAWQAPVQVASPRTVVPATRPTPANIRISICWAHVSMLPEVYERLISRKLMSPTGAPVRMSRTMTFPSRTMQAWVRSNHQPRNARSMHQSGSGSRPGVASARAADGWSSTNVVSWPNSTQAASPSRSVGSGSSQLPPVSPAGTSELNSTCSRSPVASAAAGSSTTFRLSC